jgi:hypothetical protein
MRNVFHDPALQKQFDKDGYVCLPFISPEKVEMLKQAFLRHFTEKVVVNWVQMMLRMGIPSHTILLS